MPIDVVVCGATGRMGRAIAQRAADQPQLRLAGGIARAAADVAGYERVTGLEAAGELVAAADVVIDVSSPAGLRALLEAHGESLAGRALVVGTTGLEGGAERALAALASRTAVLTAANFSIGVNVLLALVGRAAAVLDADRYDVEIVEAHHRGKADAPSGTALALGDVIAAVRGGALADVRRDGRSGRPGERPRGEIGMHALRGGQVAGEHRVHFLGDLERVELAHAAADRGVFADGALAAALWLAGKPPGRYRMGQALGLDD